MSAIAQDPSAQPQHGQPYTPASVFVIDQWRRIGIEVEHKQIDPRAYYEAISRGDFDVAIDFISDLATIRTCTTSTWYRCVAIADLVRAALRQVDRRAVREAEARHRSSCAQETDA